MPDSGDVARDYRVNGSGGNARRRSAHGSPGTPNEGRETGVDGPLAIVGGLRAIGIPYPPQLRDGRVVPVHPQVHGGPDQRIHQLEAGGSHRSLLASRPLARFQCGEKTFNENRIGETRECIAHRPRDSLRGEDVARGDAVLSRRGRPNSERAGAAVVGALATRSEHRELSIVGVGVGLHEHVSHPRCIEPSREQVEAEVAERGIGDVLAGHCSHPRTCPRAAACHAGAGRGHHHAELAASGAAPEQGKGHRARPGGKQ